MTVELRLESEADIKSRRSEQVDKSFEGCRAWCTWRRRRLKGTEFDDGKGRLTQGLVAPWVNFSHYPQTILLREKQL